MGGGMGARNGLPGLSGVHTHMSNTRNTPIEALEQSLPVRVTTYALRKNSGGAGEYRGGDGLIREFEMLAETTVTVLTERRENPPYGAQGGSLGSCGRNTLIRADGSGRTPPRQSHPPPRARRPPPDRNPRRRRLRRAQTISGVIATEVIAKR